MAGGRRWSHRPDLWLACTRLAQPRRRARIR